MERDSIIAHGATSFLKESMLTRGDDYYIAISVQMYNSINELYNTSIWYANITNITSTNTNANWVILNENGYLKGANVFGNNSGLISVYNGVYYYYKNFILESSYNSTEYPYLYAPSNYTSDGEAAYNNSSYIFNNNYMILPITYKYTVNSTTNYAYLSNLYMWDLSNCNLSNPHVYLLYDSSYLLQQYYNREHAKLTYMSGFF
jgi:hypothetical protein